MSDDGLEIRSGGVIAVDTESLRAAAARLILLAADADGVRARLAEATGVLTDAGVWIYPPAIEAGRIGEEAASIADDLRAMADMYDLVEIWIALDAAELAGDTQRVAALRAQWAQAAEGHADAAVGAAAAITGWTIGRRGDIVAQYGAATPSPFGSLMIGADPRPAWGVVLGGGALLGTLVLDAVGRGAVGAAPLGGRSQPVTVTPLRTGRGAAPAGLADMAKRIPQGAGRVRVEKYTMPDASTQFVAYVAGTRMGEGSDEPWDMTSNLRLYTGERSASYDATMAALAAAGAEPGDTVHLAGHSQGAMIASHVAASGVYSVPTLLTLGDPVQVDVGPATMNIDVRHGDDPVSALAAGGHPGGVGSPESFVAQRTSPETFLGGEAAMDPHALTRYTETAALLDASSDPRMVPVRTALDDLGSAASVQVTVYRATLSPADGG